MTKISFKIKTGALFTELMFVKPNGGEVSTTGELSCDRFPGHHRCSHGSNFVIHNQNLGMDGHWPCFCGDQK